MRRRKRLPRDPPKPINKMEHVIIRGGTWNICGLQDKVDVVIETMQKNEVDWLFLCETFLKGVDKGSKRPREFDEEYFVSLIDGVKPPGRGRASKGLALMVNPKRGLRRTDFEEIDRSSQSYYGIWRLKETIIIGVYLPPSLDIDAVERILEEPFDKIPPRWNALQRIVVGDINGRIAYGLSNQSDERGRTVKRILARRGLQVIEPQREVGYTHCNTFVKCRDTWNGWIDWCAIDAHRAPGLSCQIVRDKDARSDHRMISFAYTQTLSNHRTQDIQQRKPLRWRVNKLLTEETATAYRNALESKLMRVRRRIQETLINMPPTEAARQARIDAIYKGLIEAIHKAADSIVGRLSSFTRGKSKRFSSDRVKEMNAAVKRLESTPLAEGETRRQRRRSLEEAMRDLMRAKAEEVVKFWLAEFLEKQRALSHGQLLKSFRRRRANKSRVVAPPDSQEKLEEFANYWENHFTTWKEIRNGPPVKEDGPYSENDLGDPWEAERLDIQITAGMVIEALKHSGNGKAPGVDAITKELVALPASTAKDDEWESHPVVSTLTALFQLTMTAGTLPTQWSQGQMVLIPKKGSSRVASNLRPITLLPFFRKLFEKVCLQRFITLDGFHKAQGGFCASKSTLDMAATVDHACRIAKRKRRRIALLFLDIKSAYDAVDRNLLYRRLRERGTPERAVRLIQRMLSRSTATIISGTRESRRFNLAAGVPQGSTVSPLLYNAFIDDLFKKVDEMGRSNDDVVTAQNIPGPDQFNTRLRICGYADDVVLMAHSIARLRAFTRACEEHSRMWKYAWSPAKCVQIADRNWETVSIYGSPVDRKESFIYLGVPVTIDGIDAREMVKRNSRKAEVAMDAMRSLGLETRSLEAHRATLVFKSFVRSCMDYGVAIANLSTEVVKGLDKMQRKLLIRLFGGCFSSNYDVLARVADSQTYKVRSMELTARWFIRAVQGQQGHSILLDWLSDALNDTGSTLRRNVDPNALLRVAGLEQKLPLGVVCRSAWTQAEVATTLYHRDGRPPWQALPRESPNPFSNAEGWRLKDEHLAEFRKDQELTTRRRARQRGALQYLRDLPFQTGSLLKPLAFDRRSQRLLVCWWTGLMPGHDANRMCGICNRAIFDPDVDNSARGHVAECIGTSHQELVAVANNLTGRGDEAEAMRSSQDIITKLIWSLYESKDLKRANAVRVKEALEAVAIECLGWADGDNN